MIRMTVQVVFVNDANGKRDVHEIAHIDRRELCPERLGLSLAEAKEVTGGIQQVLTGAQIVEWQEARRACPDCGRRRSLKGHHRLSFRTAFGALSLKSERVRSCPCVSRTTRTESPLADLLSERVSPDLLYLETKFASLVSYGLTVKLLGELLPLERPLRAEQVRRNLFRVAGLHEAALAAVPTTISPEPWDEPSQALPDGPLFVGIDGGYVRGRNRDWFEAIAGKSIASFHRDGRAAKHSGRCFAFVQTADDQPWARLVETLRQQGIHPRQQVVFLSDGADSVRRLQRVIAPEAEQVLDWFHVAMRLTVLGQMVKGAWIDPAKIERTTAELDRIKWLLWHGNAPDALDAIGVKAEDLAVDLRQAGSSPSLKKLAETFREFAIYIGNNERHIVNYGERYRAGERISTGFVESAINQIVDKRFDKRQSMRWTRRGAHLLLQTRTRVLNGDLDHLLRQRYPAFRAAPAHAAPAL
jgi:hypothetical protein